MLKHTLAAALVISAPVASQDAAFVRAYERAQAARPAELGVTARIAPEGEPGTPLVIQGRVYEPDGQSPAGGIVVFAYQTDARGLYDEPSAGPHSWRLKGWALTDADGRFEFHTIRPASYPGSNVAQHVHVHLEGRRYRADGTRRSTSETTRRSARESARRRRPRASSAAYGR